MADAATEPKTAAIGAEEISTEDAQRLEEANNFVRRRMFWSAGVGLVPLPLVDLVALTAMQIDMVRVLAKNYDVPFRRDAVKSIVSGLLGGVVPVSMAPTFGSVLKAVPIIGAPLGILSTSILGGAATYAIGKVFIMHFEAGGTILDFDPDAMNDYFMEKFNEGKQMVKDVKKGLK